MVRLISRRKRRFLSLLLLALVVTTFVQLDMMQHHHLVYEDTSIPLCSAAVTLVTAYYDLKSASKYGASTYASWNSNYFSLADAMIIFTDASSAQEVSHMRSASRGCTAVVIEELTATHTAGLLDWEREKLKDPEATLHSTPLYIIWNQKSSWLMNASISNPFASKYFFWTDAGQFRDRAFVSKLKENEPWVKCTNLISPGCMLLLSIEPFNACELETDSRGRAAFLSSLSHRIGGGNFGGDADAIRNWYKRYYEMLIDYHREGLFVGKDQPIMASVCLQNVGFCKIISAGSVNEAADPWFAMQPVLHDCDLTIKHEVVVLSQSTSARIEC